VKHAITFIINNKKCPENYLNTMHRKSGATRVFPSFGNSEIEMATKTYQTQ